jgi:cyclopropane-fatty-acyl-phospholipid synthase
MTQRDDTLNNRNELPSAGGLAKTRDELLLNIAAGALRNVGAGRLCVTMPSGQVRTIGSGDTIHAAMTLRSLKPVWRSIRRGSLGFAESYIQGDAKTDDLGNLIRFFIDNYPALESAGGSLFKSRMFDKAAHKLRRNTRAGSRRNIAAHYDLGNAFYELWLDPGMTYSSALFRDGVTSLEAAQDAKYQRAWEALGAGAGSSVLEIGCGWGGMAEKAARAGANVTGVTVSREQFDWAKTRLADAGLGDRTDIVFQDYRDISGTFDGIVSIEMIEAVGEDHWPQYFNALARHLKPGAAAVLQAITIREQDFDLYRARPDFIQRYIFPGGMLPTPSLMREHAAAAGLTFEPVERFGLSYARTLAMWRDRFEAAWPKIAELGFDEQFRRMWNYYLTYCEVGFEKGVVDVGLYRFVKS